MKPIIVVATIILGFGLLALSFVWPKTSLAKSSWTDEKAARRSTIQDRLHYLGFVLSAAGQPVSMHSHMSDETKADKSPRDFIALKAEFDQLTEENGRLNAEFQAAYDRPRTTATVFKWTGLSLAVLGVIGWYALKNS